MEGFVKVFVMDVDGTLTDGKIYMSNSGELFKTFDIKDGYGIRDLLLPIHIHPVIITGRNSKIVQNRCTELGIGMLYQGVSNKLYKMTELLDSLEADLCEVAYIGDDLNDLSCMNLIKNGGGVVGCPANAIKAVKEVADFISDYKGGEGAVRDFIDYLLEIGKINILN